MGLKKKELTALNEKILSEKERILKKLNIINKEEFHLNSEDRFDEVDQAASEYERSQMLRFRNRDLFYIKKLDKALLKFKDKEYGVCEDCDSDIKFERLMARPTAELCITCKDESERVEQGNFVARQSKSIGQRVDLTGAHASV